MMSASEDAQSATYLAVLSHLNPLDEYTRKLGKAVTILAIKISVQSPFLA